MLTDKEIQDTVFAVMRRWKDDRAWDRFTRESGAYDVTSLRAEVMEIIKAVLVADGAIDDASLELGRLLNHIHGDSGQYVAVQGWKKAATDALAKLTTLGVPAPFERGSWQHAVDDELANYGRTSQSFATPHEAVKWLLSVERDVPLACLSVTPECRESGCAAARNAGVKEGS